MSALQDGIVVLGSGMASGPPDVLHAQLGCTATSDSVGGALAAATQALDALRDSLVTAGVAAADVSTSAMRVENHWSATAQAPQGYEAFLGLAVSLRDLDGAGGVLAAALAAAGDAGRLHGVSLSISDPGPLLTTARELALADAREKAEHLAALSGRELGALRSVEEHAEPQLARSSTALAAMSGRASGRASIPVERGETEVVVVLGVRWDLS